MIITIDGPAASGKSTIAKRLAKRLHFSFFDTGAMYRGVAYYLLKEEVPLDDEKAIEESLTHFSFYFLTTPDLHKRYFVNDIDVTEAIRTPEVTQYSSLIATKYCVRKALVPIQREYGKKHHVVFEGRDMGTVVFPQAEIKFFLKANIEKRAERRYEELKAQFPQKELDKNKIFEELKKRDEQDISRSISPLRCPADAMIIDTSTLTVDELLEEVLKKLQKKKKTLFVKERPFYRFVCFVVRLWFRLFYRLRFYGLEHFFPGRAMLASNHVSFFDPMVIGISCPEEIHYLAKDTLFSIPILGRCIRALNSHPISGTTADKKTFRLIESVLQEEKKVVLFPEGTRQESDKIGTMMRGIGLLSYKTNSPILPIYIQGTYKIWGRKRKWPRLFGKIRCIFGTLISPDDFQHLEKREAISAITEQLSHALIDLQKWTQEGCKGNLP